MKQRSFPLFPAFFSSYKIPYKGGVKNWKNLDKSGSNLLFRLVFLSEVKQLKAKAWTSLEKIGENALVELEDRCFIR